MLKASMLNLTHTLVVANGSLCVKQLMQSAAVRLPRRRTSRGTTHMPLTSCRALQGRISQNCAGFTHTQSLPGGACHRQGPP